MKIKFILKVLSILSMKLLIITLFLGCADTTSTTGTVSAQKPRIVLQEDFESASKAEMFLKWDDISNPDGMMFSSDVPSGTKGKQSLMMTYSPGQNSGGHLFKSLPEGYDTLYARFYVKFLTKFSKVHHFVKMGGTNPPSKWPMGNAGKKPRGDDWFITGIEPMGDRWSWDFYTYWMNMRGYADPNFFWGNSFNPDPPSPHEQGKWICVEFMMTMNNPVSSSNGEQAFWINGKKVLHMGKGFPKGYWIWDRFKPDPDSTGFEGFRWRNTEKLKLNFFWLSYYMTAGKPGEIDKILFDDVIVSTGYVGPLVP